MTPPRSPDRGAADAAALAAALVLAAAAFVPTVLLRQGNGWRKCNEEALLVRGAHDPRPAGARPGVTDALLAAAAAQKALGRSPFRPDPSRIIGPPLPVEVPSPPAGVAADRVADLEGRVFEGRLSIKWTPSPGSTATALRIEGLGGPDAIEREFPADESSVELPVPGTSGTVVVKASPVGLAGPVTEARVSIPYRIAVEVVRAERANEDTGSAILRLRRVFDGTVVEADFALHEADPVGDLSSVSPGGPIVDFRTDLVLEAVRDLQAPGPFIEVPLFGPEGRVRRDAEGRPLSYGRASTVDAGQEVVLRGPNDERRVVPVR